MSETRTYYGISIFNSRTFWVNAALLVVGILSATEVLTIIPARYLPTSTAIVAAINIWLRMVTVRPAVLIAPGATAQVEVPRVGPPAPPVVTD